MSAIEPNWPSLIVFAIAWLTICVGFFFVSGSLPVRAAPPAVQTGAGPALVWFNLAVLALLFTVAVVFAISELRWTSLVVASGLIFLFAPFIVQDLPRQLKDTQLGLVLMACLSVLALLVLYAAGGTVSLGGLF